VIRGNPLQNRDEPASDCEGDSRYGGPNGEYLEYENDHDHASVFGSEMQPVGEKLC
jgi:hypothetical protein